jgi:spermidine synthase
VIQLCKKLFGDINAKAFKDKRMTVEVADAFEYLGRTSSKNRFDLIIADRPDPVGPGKALFGETFYDRVKGALRKGGYATFQTGVPFYQPWEITEALNDLAVLPRSGSVSPWCPPWYRRLHGALPPARAAGVGSGRHPAGGQGL